ncbi:MAG: chemotaxis protein CheW [Bacillota bacterium]|jgi:purine-binding chemotaxis protein CheW
MNNFSNRLNTPPEGEDTQKDKFLTFVIGGETYGIDILFVTEIIGMQPITFLPDLPDYMKGIINLRGKIIPVMDVRVRFKHAPQEYNERTCIIIINSGAINLGLIVDAVAEVITIPESNRVAPPTTQMDCDNRYIKAVGKVEDQVKLLLDCDQLLSSEPVTAVEQVVWS